MIKLRAFSVLPFILLSFYNSAFADTNLNNKLQEMTDNARKKFHVSALSMSIITPKQEQILSFISGETKKKNGSKLTSNNLFQIGSDTKSFTTAMLMKLQSEGKVSINDPLGKYLPQYKKWGDIKISYLLHNNSGIPNYTEAKAFQKTIDDTPKKQWTDKELISFAYKKPAMFKPGNGWHYCNTNFILAGMIIEKVTGKKLGTLFNENFLNGSNLNLKDTFYTPHQYDSSIEKRMVHGYDDEGKDITNTNLSWASAAGAMVSNSNDLVRWTYLLSNGKVIPKQQFDQMLKTVSPETGKPNTTADNAGYGMAIGFRKNKAGLWWGHEGETLGYHAIFAYYPKSDIYIAVTTNGLKNTNLQELIEQVALTLEAKTTKKVNA